MLPLEKKMKRSVFLSKLCKSGSSNGNLTWQANALNNLGVLHYLQGDYDKAILVLEEGLLCAKRSGYYVRIEALLSISLGDVFAEVEDFSLADQYYQQGYEIAEEIGDRFLLNYLSLARANLFIQQLDLESGKSSARECEQIDFIAELHNTKMVCIICFKGSFLCMREMLSRPEGH